MDEAIIWAKRGFWVALFFGMAQTAVGIATWLGWKPQLGTMHIPPIPPLQFFLSGSCFLFLAITWLVIFRSRSSVTRKTAASDWREPFHHLPRESINNRAYVNESIELDGKSFRDCSFENVTFMFRGTAPAEFLGNTRVEGGFSLNTDDPAIMLYAKLQRMARAFPGARIKEGAIDDKGRLLADNFGIHPILDAKVQAEALSALSVYPQDLHVKLLHVETGRTLDTEKRTLFLKLEIVSDDDAGLREMMIWFAFKDRSYLEVPYDDLSGWIIQKPFDNPELPYKSFDEKPLQTVSLWRDVQHGGLKAGLVKVGWVGVHIPDVNFRDAVTKVRIQLLKTNPRRSYKFHFSKWKESEEKIFDIGFRQLP